MAITRILGATAISPTIPASAGGTGTTSFAPGKILQVIFATTVAQVNNNTTSYTDTNLTASITPSSTSSKIYVIVNQANKLQEASQSGGSAIKILRDSTTIYGGDQAYENFLSITGASAVQRYDRNNLNFLDTPSSTNSLTYKTQARAYTAGDIISCQPEGIKSTITLMEIAG
jgi:hypothetical protein|tara:strand:- start:296 stop:814 length:519 start_codon:yes stop_codon:yes gene_type:complete